MNDPLIDFERLFVVRLGSAIYPVAPQDALKPGVDLAALRAPPGSSSPRYQRKDRVSGDKQGAQGMFKNCGRCFYWFLLLFIGLSMCFQSCSSILDDFRRFLIICGP